MEEFRDIEGYEGLYQVSNMGRVKSLNYNKTGKEKIMKIGKYGCGYLFVNLYKNGKMKHISIHRLVAQAFLENPLNLPEVNHIDENKENNSVGNLEWCDRKYNCNHGTRNERISIQIDQFTKNGRFIKTWLSIHDAGRNGYNQGHIVECCKCKRKSHKGYIWKYHKEI